MAKASTGLRNIMLGTSDFNTAMTLGFIYLYSGTVPNSPDDATTGTVLCKISNNSGATGLTFAPPVAGTIEKTSAEIWTGTVINGGGTATFYRFISADATDNTGEGKAASTTFPRMQGTIGTSGADMNLTSTVLTNGATQTINFFSHSFLQ